MKNTSGLPEKRKRVEKREESRVGKKIEPRGRWKREHQRRKEEIEREGERERVVESDYNRDWKRKNKHKGLEKGKKQQTERVRRRTSGKWKREGRDAWHHVVYWSSRSIHESHSGCQPSYLPQALPLSLIRPTHFPPDHHSPLRPPPLPSSILHPPSLPPSPLQQTNPPALHPLPGHQPPAKPPSDIHRRVSSELIIKCIVVPARALQYVPSIHYFSPPTLPPSRAISFPPPPLPPLLTHFSSVCLFH